MRLTFKYIYALSFLIPNSLFAQVDFSKEYSFLQYLIEEQLYDEAFILGDNLLGKTKQISQKDSVFYSLGKLSQKTKQAKLSTQYFSQVSPNATFYPETAFKTSYGYLELRSYAESEEVLSTISSFSSLKNIELAGLSLLKRDYQTFSQLSTKINAGEFSATALKLNNLYQTLKQVKKRSPLVAALLSTFVPGLGKGYVGEWRQMWGSFLPELFLGVQTWEAYRKDGVKSARFIIYAGLFSVFHMGNIWGSTFTVKLKRAEQYEQIDEQIIFELKLPINRKF